MLSKYFAILWPMTMMGEFVPEKPKKFIFKYLLDVEKEDGVKNPDDPSNERMLAGLFFINEDTLSGQIVKYMDENGVQEELAFNVFCFEKRNVLYGLILRTFVQDIPNILLIFIILGCSHSLKSCENSLTNDFLYISLVVSVATILMSVFMSVLDYMDREVNFLTIL